MEQIHHANAYFCFLVGIGLNVTLIWAIIKKSSEELRLYSRILLQIGVLDLYYLVVTFLAEPVSDNLSTNSIKSLC